METLTPTFCLPWRRRRDKRRPEPVMPRRTLPSRLPVPDSHGDLWDWELFRLHNKENATMACRHNPRRTGIYCIYNKLTGYRYIGQAVCIRCRNSTELRQLRLGIFSRSNRHLQRAWDKYGESAFEWLTLVCCKPEQLTQYEQDFVDKAYLVGNCYNIRTRCVTSSLGVQLSCATRARMSVSRAGRKHTPEQCAKISASLMGHITTPEARAKLSVAQMGRRHALETLIKISAHNGMYSAASRAKISAAQTAYHARRRALRDSG